MSCCSLMLSRPVLFFREWVREWGQFAGLGNDCERSEPLCHFLGIWLGSRGRNYLQFHQVWLGSSFGCFLWDRWQASGEGQLCSHVQPGLHEDEGMQKKIFTFTSLLSMLCPSKETKQNPSYIVDIIPRNKTMEKINWAPLPAGKPDTGGITKQSKLATHLHGDHCLQSHTHKIPDYIMGRLEDWGTKSVCLHDEASDEKTAVIYTFHSGKSMDIIYNRKAHEQKHHHIMLRCEGKSIVSNLKSASGRLYQAVIRGGHYLFVVTLLKLHCSALESYTFPCK